MLLAEYPGLGEQWWGTPGWGIPAPPWGRPDTSQSPRKGVQLFSLYITLFLGGGKAILGHSQMFLWLFLSPL